MVKPLKRIVVTGGAGQIAYSLVFRIASGEMFGKDQPVALHLLEVPEAVKALEGVKMELEDSAFPLLREVKIGSDPYQLFASVELALLVGARPRTAGMERKELLEVNGRIFIEQGKALNAVADPSAKVLVVGNPCNTNCLIAMHHAPNIPRTHFHAMTRLDENRAKCQLALKAGVGIEEVHQMAIWGNHSATQVPDFYHAQIRGKPAAEVIQDKKWLQEQFVPIVQQRGAAVIAARGKSSAASAAAAIIDAVKALVEPTKKGDWFSTAVSTDGNHYGIQEGLIFSFPCTSRGDGNYAIVEGLKWNEDLERKIRLSEAELLEERQSILGGVR